MEKKIQFQNLGCYRGVEIYVTENQAPVFICWLGGKYYSSPKTATIYDLIDNYWKVKAN